MQDLIVLDDEVAASTADASCGQKTMLVKAEL